MDKHTPDRMCCPEFSAVMLISTPLGILQAASFKNRICSLEFSEAGMRGKPYTASSSPTLEKLRSQIHDYFNGKLKEFSIPLEVQGTPFQQRVWRELLSIPYGKTISYQELAQRIGKPGATRAVAGACRMNRICILIPCHRVIGKDGGLAGYAGGVWRKGTLLELERSGCLPAGGQI